MKILGAIWVNEGKIKKTKISTYGPREEDFRENKEKLWNSFHKVTKEARRKNTCRLFQQHSRKKRCNKIIGNHEEKESNSNKQIMLIFCKLNNTIISNKFYTKKIHIKHKRRTNW